MSRTILNATPEGLKQRIARLERGVADLHREQSWQYDPPETASAGGGVPTMFVAASDATDKSKALADYVCDGTDDHEEINEAITAALAASTNWGGRILLSEGQFNATDTISLGAGMVLSGFGDATYLDTANAAVGVDLGGYGATVENLTITGWSATGSYGVRMLATAGSNVDQTVRNCAIQFYDYGVYAEDAARMRVLDCRFKDISAWGVFILYGSSPHGVILRGNAFQGSFNAIATGAGGIEHAVIADNSFVLGGTKIAISLGGSNDVSITGNAISAPTTTKASSTPAIKVSLTSTRVNITGNVIEKRNGVAIVVGSTSSDVLLSSNAIWGHVEIECDRVVTVDNQFSVDATYAPTITVVSGTDNCFSGNFLPGGLGSFSDSGTTTQRGTNFAQGGTW